MTCVGAAAEPSLGMLKHLRGEDAGRRQGCCAGGFGFASLLERKPLDKASCKGGDAQNQLAPGGG